MSPTTQFSELADYLCHKAVTEGFINKKFHVGPLGFSLSIAPDCTELGLDVAFACVEMAAGASHRCPDASMQADLNVYVLQLQNDNCRDCLGSFLTYRTAALHQLSGQGQVLQFVIRDKERQMIKIYDQINQFGLLAFAKIDLLPSWELFSPIKEFIHLHALNQSCLLLHGASLISPNQPNEGTLIVGPGGSGKSTLTAYAIEQGMFTNGDDYVLVDVRREKPQCWSVYRTLKLHPSSPVLQGSSRWQAWRSDSFTGKSVILADTVANGGALLPKAALSRICGVSLMQSPAVHNPKANSSLSDPYRHPYLHSCMSTIQQVPYRIDVTLALSKKLHKSIPYAAHTIAPGIKGLQQALDVMQV